MEKRVCDTCPLWNECSTRIGKKARVLYFNEHDILRHKRYRAIKRLPKELRKLRANVEETILELSRRFYEKKLKVRGAFKARLFGFFVSLGINFGRIYRYKVR